MMLTIFRRHLRSCPHRKKGRSYRRCRCPIWYDGRLGGVEMRKSLGLRDWQKAQDRVREWEAENRIEKSERVTLATAWDRFIADAEARQLETSTIKKYKLLRSRMQDFARRAGRLFIDEFDLATLSEFRHEWKYGPGTSLKHLERLRAFFRFSRDRKWIAENPATGLKGPKVTLRPTMPFSRDDMVAILKAFDEYAQRAGSANAQRLRAFVLLLRYSGMRIGDAVQLTTDRIQGNRLFLYTQKTGQPVNVALPAFVVSALDACPRGSDRHFFWTGRSTVHSIVGKWQRRLGRIFELADKALRAEDKPVIENGHAHRFRDTFAVEFLLGGGTLEQLAVLLGHSSTRVTERHYSPWVRDRQAQLEAQLERIWAADPVAQAETRGTYQVHHPKHIN